MADSDGEEDILLFPLTDIDANFNQSTSDGRESSGGSDADEEETAPKPAMSLRERRIKRAYAVAQPQNLKVAVSPSVHRYQWIKAIGKAKRAEDPWAEYHIEKYDCEVCTRHRYSSLKKTWVKDEVLVKMEPKVPVSCVPFKVCIWYSNKICEYFVGLFFFCTCSIRRKNKLEGLENLKWLIKFFACKDGK